jgi:hypothetical protein
MTRERLSRYNRPAPGNMDPTSDLYEFLCDRNQELQYLTDRNRPRKPKAIAGKVIPIHVHKYPITVWELFLGTNTILGRNLPRDGLTFKEIEFVRQAEPEYLATLRRNRLLAKSRFLGGRDMRGIWVGNEWWTVYRDIELPFVLFADRHFFNSKYLPPTQATLNQMNQMGRMLGSNERMHGEDEFTAEIWQRICILEPYVRATDAMPRDGFLSVSDPSAFSEPTFFLSVYFRPGIGWSVAMACESNAVVRKGTLVKMQAGEIRPGDGLYQVKTRLLTASEACV